MFVSLPYSVIYRTSRSCENDLVLLLKLLVWT